MSAITKLRDSQAEQHNALGAGIRQIGELVPQYFNALPQYFTAIQQQVVAAQQHADAGLRAIIDILRPPQPETPASEPAVGGDWEEALLGGELAHNPALNADKNQLLKGVLNGDPGACGLVGSLLLFRSAAADKMPPLLKDIGEAFYRWQPKTSNRPSELEKALVEWLHAGLRPGGHGQHDRTGQSGRAFRFAAAQFLAAGRGGDPGPRLDRAPRQWKGLYQGQRGRKVTGQ